MAILLEEPGYKSAALLARGASLCSVNLAEIMAKCIEKAMPPHLALDYINSSSIDIVPFEAEDAIMAGWLFERAKKGILSLGDRACLALAIREGATVLTADRIWAELDLPCRIELIR